MKQWNCNTPKAQLIYLGKSIIYLIRWLNSWLMFCFPIEQKMNTTSTIQAPFTCLTQPSSNAAGKRSAAVKRVKFVHLHKRKQSLLYSNSSFTALRKRRKSPWPITCAASVNPSVPAHYITKTFCQDWYLNLICTPDMFFFHSSRICDTRSNTIEDTHASLAKCIIMYYVDCL